MDRELIRQRRERREGFLRALYQDVDGHVNEFVNGFDVAARLGADEAEARRIIAYYEEKSLIKVDDHKTGIVRMTAVGIDAIENEVI